MNIQGNISLVAVYRGGELESFNSGAIAVVDAEGRLLRAAGDPDQRVFLRSGAKPFQVLPLIEKGAVDRFGFPDEEIAVMTGSHGGEPFQVRAVASILKRAQLHEGMLRCGAHPPFHRATAEQLLREGGSPQPLQNNCSGKHAAMLALARHLGEDREPYTDPSHVVQRLCLEAVASCCGTPLDEVVLATDGCSVPTFSLPLARSALGYARLLEPCGVSSRRADALRRVARAMVGYPAMLQGEGSLCTDLMRALPGALIAKVGADGYLGVSFREGEKGIGMAVKIADGDSGAVRAAAVLEALRQAGVLDAGPFRSLWEKHVPAVRTVSGEKVGRVVPNFSLNAP